MIMISIIITSKAQTKVELSNGIKAERFSLKRDWGNLNYEVFGKGEPLLILHGNGGSVKGKYNVIPKLVEDYKVIAVDSRCHGLRAVLKAI